MNERVLLVVVLLLMPLYFTMFLAASPKPAGGPDEPGELSPAARQLIRDHMFSLFAVGGAIVAIVSGVAGYLINDLAKERAMATALQEMQQQITQPLSQGLASVERARDSVVDFKAEVETLSVLVQQEEFVERVVRVLSQNDSFRSRVESGLAEGVAQILVEEHADARRGPPGEIPDVEKVAQIRAASYADDLRGPPAEIGADAPQLKPEAVADAILAREGDGRARAGWLADALAGKYGVRMPTEPPSVP